MVSGKLLSISSDGKAIWASPSDGELIKTEKISGSSYLPPIIVDETIYILNDNGDLTAYK